MSPRLTILALALLLAVTSSVLLRRAGSPAEPAVPTGPDAPSSALPSKSDPRDRFHRPDRFADLDPELREIVLRLEALRGDWHGRLADDQSRASWRHEWVRFSRAQITLLETPQIQALIDWLASEDHSDPGGFWEYKNALYHTWASRDSEAAHASIMALGKRHQALNPTAETPVSRIQQGFYGSYIHVLFGLATDNPAQAWKLYQQDCARCYPLRSSMAPDLILDLFELYTNKAPTEAWAEILTHPNRDFVFCMLDGYVAGAPAGQDWNALANDLFASTHTRGFEHFGGAYLPIAKHWIAEEPEAALDWIAAHTHLAQTMLQSDDPFADPLPVDSLSPDDKSFFLKGLLLDEIYHDRPDLCARGLEQLLSGDDALLATSVLAAILDDNIDLSSLPAIDLIPKIPDPDLRAKTFLLCIRALRVRGSYDSDFERPNTPYEAVRSIFKNLDLPSEARAEAQKALAHFEELESLNRAAWESHQPDE